MAILTGTRGRRDERTRLWDLQEDEFEELNTATIDVIVRFPELETESQYMREVVPRAGAHH